MGGFWAAVIEVEQGPEEGTVTAENSCYWTASCTITGRAHTARSRRIAPRELARLLVGAGIPDQAPDLWAAKGVEEGQDRGVSPAGERSGPLGLSTGLMRSCIGITRPCERLSWHWSGAVASPASEPWPNPGGFPPGPCFLVQIEGAF
jgi:hypothetical protein